jgi:uncharacterized protein YgbK (DUF1537 family)
VALHERELLAVYPPEISVSAREVAEIVGGLSSTLIVLDDDPTGTQSVADVPVLTRWEVEDFHWALAQGSPAIYVLTNTRSLDPEEAELRNREVVKNALEAAEDPSGLHFVSRSDSTLRGHFPLETDVIAQTLFAHSGRSVDGVVIVPAFPDAGRVTVGGIHYVRSGESLIPVAHTEFASDSTFGYQNSDLGLWVEEKTGGRVPARDVIRLTLDIIRSGSEAIVEAIARATDSQPIVADAVVESDLRLLALGLIEAEQGGKSLLYRVGPPFVRARIGQEPRAPLTSREIFDGAARDVGGLIVVGSHVDVTTRQLARLEAENPDTLVIELDVDAIVGESDASRYLDEATHRVRAGILGGDVILHTSRKLVKSHDAAVSLAISRAVSAAIVGIVQNVAREVTPRFVIAKGGITSSDVAALGLGIRRATVLGPMLPGIVSLWRPMDGPALGLPYVVFAGNVGDDEALVHVVATLDAD